jgi:hypothetical protein
MCSGDHPLDIGTAIIGTAVGGADGSAGGIAAGAFVAGAEPKGTASRVGKPSATSDVEITV